MRSRKSTPSWSSSRKQTLSFWRAKTKKLKSKSKMRRPWRSSMKRWSQIWLLISRLLSLVKRRSLNKSKESKLIWLTRGRSMIDSWAEIEKDWDTSMTWWGLEKWSSRAMRVKLQGKTNLKLKWRNNKTTSKSIWRMLLEAKSLRKRNLRKRKDFQASQNLFKNQRLKLHSIMSKADFSNQSKLVAKRSKRSTSISMSKKPWKLKATKKTIPNTIVSNLTKSTDSNLQSVTQSLSWLAKRTNPQPRDTILLSPIEREKPLTRSLLATIKTFPTWSLMVPRTWQGERP